jgi:peptidoglycan hydrolase CwlO-like protein
MRHENDDQARTQWRADLAQITARLDDLDARIEALLHTAHTSLAEEITTLKADLERLEADIDTAGADIHLRQVMGRIKELNALGAAAYQLLQADIGAKRDSTEAEIKALETLAASAKGDSKARLMERIEQLRAAQAYQTPESHSDEESTDSAPG